MGQPTYTVYSPTNPTVIVGTYVIATDAYVVPRGLSNPRIVTFPRTIGGIIEESGVIEQSLLLKCYMVGNPNTNRTFLENVNHELNELIGPFNGNLFINGNTYNNAFIKTITYDPTSYKNTLTYTIEFILADQNTGNQFNNTGSNITQLPCIGLQNFSRGRKMTFTNKLDDGTYRTFNFWHNFDNIKDYETYIVIKHSFSYGGHARVIKVGGFEKMVCNGWIILPDVNTRQNGEAYFYNIINGPLGRLGTLIIDGQQIINNAFLQYCTVEDSTAVAIKYQLIFVVSLQC